MSSFTARYFIYILVTKVYKQSIFLGINQGISSSIAILLIKHRLTKKWHALGNYPQFSVQLRQS